MAKRICNKRDITVVKIKETLVPIVQNNPLGLLLQQRTAQKIPLVQKGVKRICVQLKKRILNIKENLPNLIPLAQRNIIKDFALPVGSNNRIPHRGIIPPFALQIIKHIALALPNKQRIKDNSLSLKGINTKDYKALPLLPKIGIKLRGLNCCRINLYLSAHKPTCALRNLSVGCARGNKEKAQCRQRAKNQLASIISQKGHTASNLYSYCKNNTYIINKKSNFAGMNPISANKIKELRKLQQKKYRTESGLFIVEGQKMVEEAQKSNFKIVETYRIEEIGANAMSRISSLSTPSPILAVVEQKNHTQEEIELAAPASGRALYLGLCGVRDPGNLGTIIRIADWFGADALFCSEDCVELYNPKTIQATMGAIFRRRIVYTSIPDVISKAHAAQLPIFGTFLNGENIYRQQLPKSALVLLGNESNGIPEQVERLLGAHEKLLIPPYPADAQTSESLNVATAAAIICAEFRRP